MKRLLPLASLAALAVAAVAIIVWPSAEIKCTAKYAASQQETASQCLQDLSSETVANWTKGLAAFTLVLAGVGSIQIWFLIRAEEAAAKNISVSEQAMISAQRAYISCEGYRPFADIVKGQKGYNWRFRPAWRNAGDTPAESFDHYACCEVLNTDLPPAYTFGYNPTEVGHGIVSAKGATLGGIVPRQPQGGGTTAVTPQDILDVQAGKKYIILWGFAKYRDVFPHSKIHVSHFCFYCSPVGDPRLMDINAVRWDWVMHAQGNYFRDE